MTQITENKQNSFDNITEGRLAEWLSKQGKNIIYGLVALLALLVIIYYFSTRQSIKTERDYIQAANDFAIVTHTATTQDPKEVNDALLRLNIIMTRHPELHAAYDGTLAQLLLDQGRLTEAMPYAESTLARTKSEDLPLYADFAATTLLISQERYQEALDKAATLQLKMTQIINTQTADKRSFGDELFAFNLLRIAMLQQQLGNNKAELQAWKEWKQYAGLETNQTATTKIDTQAFRLIIQQLAIGTFTLPDYIAYREKAIMTSNSS